jgi:hypothetical protein
MTPEAWPTPSEGGSPREPLPRVDDLPVGDQGYDQDAVKAAFDSFYRHAAQLDAALRTLEAVDSFHRQAAALRADLRTLRTAGWTQQPFSASPPFGYGSRAPREGVSPAVWRVLGEVIFLVAVSVLLGIAKLQWWVIVAVMAGAFLIIAAIEWAASRERWTVAAPARPADHPVVEAEPAPRADESEASGWAAFEEAQEPSDAMTMIGGPQEASQAVEEEPAAESAQPAEPEPVVEAVAAEADEQEADEPAEAAEEPEVAAQPEVQAMAAPTADEEGHAPRRRWWRRHATSEAAAEQAVQAPDAPRHVRVIGPEEHPPGDVVDPWEQGFDTDTSIGRAEPPAEPDEETDENEAAVVTESEPEPRRRFRRR